MKIYADSNYTSVTYYAGDNVWLRATKSYDDSVVYVRVHKDYPGGIECNIIPEDAEFSSIEDFQTAASRVFDRGDDSFIVCQPKEILSTDELLQKFFPAAKSNLRLLSQFEGKDIWIVCRLFGDPKLNSTNTCYVKICRILDTDSTDITKVYCRYMYTSIVNSSHSPGLRRFTANSISDSSMFFVDDIEVIQPLELLTTEELEEIINPE